MHEQFTVHRLNAGGLEKASALASLFDACLSGVEELCADGRLLAIVRTKLEEACFFAKKAMAADQENQE